jgi:hypothetical protein
MDCVVALISPFLRSAVSEIEVDDDVSVIDAGRCEV